MVREKAWTLADASVEGEGCPDERYQGATSQSSSSVTLLNFATKNI
jgi:hypothetical protein